MKLHSMRSDLESFVVLLLQPPLHLFTCDKWCKPHWMWRLGMMVKARDKRRPPHVDSMLTMTWHSKQHANRLIFIWCGDASNACLSLSAFSFLLTSFITASFFHLVLCYTCRICTCSCAIASHRLRTHTCFNFAQLIVVFLYIVSVDVCSIVSVNSVWCRT